jgi:hypothetical protein
MSASSPKANDRQRVLCAPFQDGHPVPSISRRALVGLAVAANEHARRRSACEMGVAPAGRPAGARGVANGARRAHHLILSGGCGPVPGS